MINFNGLQYIPNHATIESRMKIENGKEKK